VAASEKAFVTFIPEASVAERYDPYGVNVYLVGSDLSWLGASARGVAASIKG
jgi:2-keto-3-deoxy-L-rhamnonate aldolase RhmA